MLVLRGAGPKGAPGMPEAGYIPIPKKLAARGVRDMVRISDARMSGTAFGTIVLHVTPESAIGGPLALVETGDRIRLDVAARRLELLVPEEELAARRGRWSPPPAHPGSDRGYLRLFLDTVTQADRGLRLRLHGPPRRPPTRPPRIHDLPSARHCDRHDRASGHPPTRNSPYHRSASTSMTTPAPRPAPHAMRTGIRNIDTRLISTLSSAGSCLAGIRSMCSG